MNIAFVPIDNRPVCYNLPKQIAELDKNINFNIPKRELLGGLNKISDIDSILKWLSDLKEIDIALVCLDTIAYGGLLPSRRSSVSKNEIIERINKFKRIMLEKNAKIFAFSSIMRISNNNVNEEEKEYWNIWGKKIFEYSYNFHKSGIQKTDVPVNILDDYLLTRKRNFEINKIYLEWQKEGFFDTLIFSKDDCAEYGLNVMEAQELEKLGAFVKTGADEIPLSLFSRAINNFNIKVKPIFLSPENKDLISNYEDISIEKSVIDQLKLADCEIDDSGIKLIINNFEDHQGEIVMKVPTKPYSKDFKTPDTPYMIADVRFANGADNSFVQRITENGFDENFLGYSAWNTSANTLGSLICSANAYIKGGKINKEGFIKLQLIRFLDDWAYQANVRQILQKPDSIECKKLMKPFEEKLFKLFGVRYNTKYSFPWNRLFEVEIELS